MSQIKTNRTNTGLKSLNLLTGVSNDGKEGRIDIEGAIYPNAIEEWGEVDLKVLKASLKPLEGVDVLNVHIHSPGGAVVEGLAMYDALRKFDAKIITHNEGMAASMGSVLFMAGDERVMAQNSVVIIHNPYGMSFGEAKDHEKSAKLLAMQKDRLLSIYLNRMHADEDDETRSEISDMMDDETWIYADDALEGHWATSIDEPIEFEAAAMVTNKQLLAQAGLTRFPADFNTRFESRHEKTVGAVVPTLTTTIEDTNDMTREELVALLADKANRDVLIALFFDSAEHTNAIAEARSDATASEGVRINEVLALSRPGLEDFVRELAFTDGMTKAEAAIAILGKIDDIGNTALDERRQHGTTVNPDDSSGDIGDLSGEELWRKEYADDVNGVRTGRTGFSDVENYIAFQKADAKGVIKHNNIVAASGGVQ